MPRIVILGDLLTFASQGAPDDALVCMQRGPGGSVVFVWRVEVGGREVRRECRLDPSLDQSQRQSAPPFDVAKQEIAKARDQFAADVRAANGAR